MTGETARIVAGRYRLLRLLGRGGMGAVWHAHDTLLERDVAVKEIWFPGGGNEPVDPADPLIRRALREAKAAARLRHPGIVTVYDVVTDEGRPWIVMELVNGRSLAEALRDHGLLPERQTAEIGLHVLDALRAAHREGIIHRDVKPANILLEDAGRVVLTDFGIAAIDDATALTATGQMIGSPAYLAPERIDGRPATATADLWALGVTLYTAVTGRSPFQRDDTQATVAAILTSRPAPPAHAGRLWPVLKGLLAKDPGRRLTTEEALRLLAAVAKPTDAPQARPASRWWPTRSRRHRSTPDGVTPTLTAPPPTLAATTLHPGRADSTDTVAADTADPGRADSTDTVAADTEVRGPAPRVPNASPPRSRRSGLLAEAASQPAAPARQPAGPESSPPTGRGKPRRRLVLATGGTALALALAGSATRWLWPVGTTPGPRPDASKEARTALPFGSLVAGPFTGHVNDITEVAVGERAGVPIAVSASIDGTLRRWDLATGQQIGPPMRGHDGVVTSVAFGQRGGLPIAVSGGHDHTVRIWDLIGGRQIGEPLGEPEDGPITTRRVIQSVAVGERDGVPVVVSGGSEDTLRLWDLTTGKQIGQPWSGHTDGVTSVAVGAIDGAPAAVSGGYDLTIRVWNLTTGKQIGEPLTGHTDAVQSVAFGELNGGPVAVSGGQDNTVRIWNLATGQQIGEPLTGHTATIWAVAFGQVDGAPSAVSGGYDRMVRLWDLTSGTQVGALSTVDRQVNSLVLHTLDGGPVCVSASGATLRVWSLAR